MNILIKMSLLIPTAAVLSCASSTIYRGQPLSLHQTAPWTGQSVDVASVNGAVTVVGDSTDGRVHVMATPFAMATSQADANAAIADCARSISLSETAGTMTVSCGTAVRNHGSASADDTGCDPLVVHVPSAALALSVRLTNGDLVLQDLQLVETSESDARVTKGRLSVTRVRGGVALDVTDGTLEADVTPEARSVIAASVGAGEATLALPPDFSADALRLATQSGAVFVRGFSDLSPSSTSRGVRGSGAASVSVTAADGVVTLEAQ
jgi:hypothetical protein